MTVATPLASMAPKAWSRAPFCTLPALSLPAADRMAIEALVATSDQPSHATALVEAQARGGLAGPAARSFAWVVSPDRDVAVPAFATDEPLWALLSGPGVLRAIADLARRLPVRLRSLVVGTPLCESGEPLLGRGIEARSAVPRLLEGLEDHARAERATGIFWKDVPAGGELDRALEGEGFASFVSLPTARIDLSAFASVHDWLTWLPQLASRGDLLRKLRDAGLVTPGVVDHLARTLGSEAKAAAEVQRWRGRARAVAERLRGRGLALPAGAQPPLRITLEERPSPALLASLMPLYEARLAAAELRWEELTPAFFSTLTRDPCARLTVARLGDVPIGFSLGLRRGRTWLCLRSGIHPELARPFSVSLLLVLVDVELALAEGCSRILLGPTAYETKARFGATSSPTVARMRLTGALRPATRAVAAVIDAANRQDGVHRLHLASARDAFRPRAAPRREGWSPSP